MRPESASVRNAVRTKYNPVYADTTGCEEEREIAGEKKA